MTPVEAAPWLEGLLHLPQWVALLIIGIYVMLKVGLAGFVLARTGRSPLWALVLIVPVLEILGIWALAYAPWPRYERARDPGRTTAGIA